MKHLLIYSSYSGLNRELEELGASKGFHSLSTTTLERAQSWIDQLDIDLLFVHADTVIAEQQDLADRLWQRKVSTPLFVFDFQESGRSVEPQVRLYGAEVAYGPGARQQLADILDQVAAKEIPAEDNFKVLVVEDLDEQRDIICIFLEGLGYPQVTGTASATAALTELRKEPLQYSCVLTDIQMPQMTGADLIREIRGDAKLRHLPIVVLTAFGTVDCLADCLKAGASGFLVKPPKKHDLQRELGRALRILSSRRDPRLASVAESEAIRWFLLQNGAM